MTDQTYQYAQRDVRSLEPYFSRHMNAMTVEGLHDKGCVAAELAWRDAEIERLRAAQPVSAEQAIAAWNRRASDQANKDLPPLPAPFAIWKDPTPTSSGLVREDDSDVFTADQMRAYARAALSASAPADDQNPIKEESRASAGDALNDGAAIKNASIAGSGPTKAWCCTCNTVTSCAWRWNSDSCADLCCDDCHTIHVCAHEFSDEDAYLIERLGQLLAGVAVALKGPEKPRHLHGYQDLPEIAQKLKLELDLYRAMRVDASAPEAGSGPSNEDIAAMARSVCHSDPRTTTPNEYRLTAGELRALLAQYGAPQGVLEDAERYRWLRDAANFDRRSAPLVMSNPMDPEKMLALYGHALDDAIDATRAASLPAAPQEGE